MKKTTIPSVESILNTVIDAIVAIDENGVIQSANPAVRPVFGYAPEELIGKDITMLMPQPYASEHDGYVKRYLRTGRARIIGAGREIVGRKKDGTVFPIYLGVSEGRREGGRRFFTGVIRDITEMRRYQDDLKRQGEFMAAVLDTVRSLVLVLDAGGRIVNFNRACEETTGYSFEEVSGKPFWDFFLAPEDREAAVRHFLKSGHQRPASGFETVWLTKKGEKRLIAWSNSFLRGGGKPIEYVIGTGIDITDRRALERMVLEIAKKEQERIGQELHDGLAQHLTSTALVAKVIEQKLAKEGSPAARDVRRVVDMVNQAVAETRELAQGLYALEMHSEDLHSSLKKLSRETEKTLGVRCAVQIDPEAKVPDAGAEHLYRIAREAVANAVKHGRAKTIKIHLKKKAPGMVELKVENDGRAFSKPAQPKGLGLRIMKSRAAMLNASLDLAPKAGGGAVVSCVVPVNS